MGGFFRGNRAAWMTMALAALTLGSSPLRADDDKVEMKPLHVGASLYFGQMFNINDSLEEVAHFNPTLTLPYTSLWMTQEATVNERLHFVLGIAGSFFYPFPEEITAGWTSYRTGGVAISQALGYYNFGDLDKPWLSVSIGQQGYKYNPYAKNFGEYLFRSEAYPTTVRTGDWGAIDNAGAGIWGIALKGNLLNGMLSNDLVFNLADQRAPLHDLSISDIVNLKFGKVFQLGGGVMLSRIIHVDPTLTSPRTPASGWFTWTAADQDRLSTYIRKQEALTPGFVATNTNVFSRIVDRTPGGLVDTVVDTSLVIGQKYWAGSLRPLVKFLETDPTASGDTIAAQTGVSTLGSNEYITANTIFVMGRFSVDPKPLLGLESALSPQDLVLYGETTIIGLDNYPIFYKSISERTPVMMGFNLPTFKWLDFLTVEMEYWKNPHMNSDFVPAFQRALQPKSTDGKNVEIPAIGDQHYDKDNNAGAIVNHNEDDLKWTVTARKSFGVWNLAFQYGTDHFRPVDKNFTPTLTEAASTKDARYYMIRLMVNL